MSNKPIMGITLVICLTFGLGLSVYAQNPIEEPKLNTKYKINEKVVVTQSSVKFLDENGNEKNSIGLLNTIPGNSWSSVSKSKNQKYITINNIYNYNQKEEKIEDAKMIMLNDEGVELWSMKHNLANIIPSPNGKYVVGTLDAAFGDAPIYVFNEKGLITKIAKDDQAWDIDFSNDGSFFALTIVTFDKTKKGIEKCQGHLIVLNEEGNELWRRANIAMGENSFCEVNISNDNIISLTTGLTERKVYHFDNQGHTIQ